ncbi:HNH endonuclease [Brucella sp.]|uniref:HNH endonuclease n=1 Tax=Brucella sp. TaxID=52132 RepID=UPI0028A9E4A6|nr:HNH endonuclease [Brucella sp.]
MIELTVVGADAPALVDDGYSNLRHYRWRLDKNGYVMRKAKGRRIYLHHVVLPGDRYPSMVRDHVNRNKLDNRSSNLRWLTMAQSAQNRDAHRNNPLGLRGVKQIGKTFRAVVYLNSVSHRLGMFKTAEEASRAASEWRERHMPFASR